MGKEVLWPGGSGKRIYAYLKMFPAVEALLKELVALGMPTVVFGSGLDKALLQKYAGPTLRFELQPLDLKQVARECDLAILNANHGTAATLLLAGKPCLMLPLFTEQMLFARKVEGLGAGLVASVGLGAEVSKALREMAGEERFSRAAERFELKYQGFTPGEQVPELIHFLESCLH